MADGIFVIQGDGSLVELSERVYDSEDVLQGLLARYPRLLGGDDSSSSSARAWLLVEREVGVPDNEKAPDRWSVDHLFIDQDAVPTLVEVKRSTDTRIRREVVGQMLDYAANAIVYWPVETIRAKFEARCDREGLDWLEVLAETFGADCDPDASWEKVKTNLQAGKIRMLFVADVIPSELRRVVEFLNTQMDPAEVLALEVRQFVGKDLKTLVPRLIGQTAEAQQKKRPSTGPTVTTAQFLDQAGMTRPFFEAVMAFAKSENLIITTGTKGFSVSTAHGNGRVVLFYGYPPNIYAKTHCIMTELAMLAKKVRGGSELAVGIREELAKRPGWQAAGNEMKYLLDHEQTEEETAWVLQFFRSLRSDIANRGPLALSGLADQA